MRQVTLSYYNDEGEEVRFDVNLNDKTISDIITTMENYDGEED